MAFDPLEILDPHKTDDIEHLAYDIYDAFLKLHPDVSWQMSAQALLLCQHWLRLRSQGGE